MVDTVKSLAKWTAALPESCELWSRADGIQAQKDPAGILEGVSRGLVAHAKPSRATLCLLCLVFGSCGLMAQHP
jgi:hypothetical protein